MNNEILKLVEQYGKNSNSFLLLYEGFQYFFQEVKGYRGAIAYVETPHAWVAGAEPLCEDEDIEYLLKQFLSAAKKRKKIVLILPVSFKVSQIAETLGYSAYPLGSEPIHSFELLQSPRTQILKYMHVAKQFLSKGAVVENFNPFTINSKDYLETQALTQKWLDAKKSEPLGFLNRVEPWTHAAMKRFFWLKFRGHILGYLAAVPIPVKKSWYFIDLIRSPEAPPGTTELLVIEAMEFLKNEGASEVTLGMSPLALLRSNKERRLYTYVSQLIFEKINFFYNFKSLFLYKKKFKPHRWEPVYILVSQKKMGLKALFNLFLAIYPAGFLNTSKYIFLRFFKKIHLFNILENIFSETIVSRSFRFTNWSDFFARSKVVMTIASINIILFFASTDDLYHLRQRMSERYGFCWGVFLERGLDAHLIQRLLISASLHWNIFHLICNLFLLFFAGLILEVFMGSRLVLGSYVIGVLLTNPLTAFLCQCILQLTNNELYQKFLKEVDLGCSLGVFSVLGSLFYFLKASWGYNFFVILCTLVYAIGSSSIMPLDHLFALFIGYFYAKFHFKNSQFFF